MSRPWRIEYEGALYHLLSRGNERSDIFMDEKDRSDFLEAVGEMSQRFDIDIFAYVLMNTHYHLLARTRRANLKKAMQWFGTTYTQRFNRRHFRSGHLFQDRHKSYRGKVQKYGAEEKRLFEDLRHGLILGTKHFVDKIRKRHIPSKAELSLPQQRQVANTFDPKNYLSRAERILSCDVEYFAQARRLSGAEKDIRDLLLYCIWATGQLKNEQIGKLFGLSYSGVSHAVKSVKSKLAKDRPLQTKFDQLNSLFKF